LTKIDENIYRELFCALSWMICKMVISKTELQSQVVRLSTDAFDAFCQDIAAMFDIDMSCQQLDIRSQTVAALKKDFKKLTAINAVNSQGLLDGNFYLIFDNDGLFTLSGVIVMLPEPRILENRRKGTAKEAEEMSDAFSEAGNLCVGSWDKIFRENMEGHGHFIQSKNFIGNPWNNPKDTIGLAGDTEIVYVPYQMTIGNYPPFNCGVIFPKSLFGENSAPDTQGSDQPPVPDLQADQPKPTDEKPTEQKPVAVENKKEQTPAQPRDVASQPVPQPKTPEPVDKKPESQKPADTQTKSQENIAPQPAQQEKPQAKAPAETQMPEIQAPTQKDVPADGQISKTIERMVLSSANLPGEYATQVSSITAQDVMQTDLLWAGPEDSVQQALAKMQQSGAGYMLIGSDSSLQGIISNYDIASAVSIYLKPMFSKWKTPMDDATLQIRLKWIMTRPVTTIKPLTPLTTIMETMLKTGLKSLPVVDQTGKTVGLVTAFDIFKPFLHTATSCNSPTNPH
jgi:acetoin utilization protein AcuB